MNARWSWSWFSRSWWCRTPGSRDGNCRMIRRLHSVPSSSSASWYAAVCKAPRIPDAVRGLDVDDGRQFVVVQDRHDIDRSRVAVHAADGQAFARHDGTDVLGVPVRVGADEGGLRARPSPPTTPSRVRPHGPDMHDSVCCLTNRSICAWTSVPSVVASRETRSAAALPTRPRQYASCMFATMAQIAVTCGYRSPSIS